MRELPTRLCREAAGDHLFSYGGARLKKNTVDYFFRKTCARAGVVGLRFHDLRHEYGSRLGAADVNLNKSPG